MVGQLVVEEYFYFLYYCVVTNVSVFKMCLIFSFLRSYALPLHSFISFILSGLFHQGLCIHDGTWQSAVYGFADSEKLLSLRRKFNHKPLPAVGSKLKRRFVEK